MNVLKNGLTGKGSHQHFEAELFKHNKTVELPPSTGTHGSDLQWQPLGPFAALDVFDDGSVYILDTPGHLPGHLNLLCRISAEKWICLCGDAFHDKRLLTGEKEVGTWQDAHGQTICIHLDKESAEESIRKLRRLQNAKGGTVELVAAHDEEWLENNQHAVLPGHLT